MTTHKLKTLTSHFQAVEKGIKKFEVRKNDRNFHVGDFLELIEIVGPDSIETGRRMKCRIDYIMHGPLFGIKEGYCVMSITTTTKS